MSQGCCDGEWTAFAPRSRQLFLKQSSRSPGVRLAPACGMRTPTIDSVRVHSNQRFGAAHCRVGECSWQSHVDRRPRKTLNNTTTWWGCKMATRYGSMLTRPEWFSPFMKARTPWPPIRAHAQTAISIAADITRWPRHGAGDGASE